MALTEPFVAHTHHAWFDHLSALARVGTGTGTARLDEVNFWSPSSLSPPKRFTVGEPLFFRLGAPDRCIAGYGFFAIFHLVDVYLAWDMFGPKNGAPTLSALAMMLGRDEVGLRRPLACTILRDAVFWPDHTWIPWGEARGYATTGVQRGRTETNPANVQVLRASLAEDHARPPADLLRDFVPVDIDGRRGIDRWAVVREGQGTFRARLLDAYGRACAVTNEHTEPVLQAAHIQPYLGPASNHVQNGLLLTQEFHTLFDRGLVTVVPPDGHGAHRLRVSPALHERWHNGRRYYQYDGQEVRVPDDPQLRPSQDALAWHAEHRFQHTG